MVGSRFSTEVRRQPPTDLEAKLPLGRVLHVPSRGGGGASIFCILVSLPQLPFSGHTFNLNRPRVRSTYRPELRQPPASKQNPGVFVPLLRSPHHNTSSMFPDTRPSKVHRPGAFAAAKRKRLEIGKTIPTDSAPYDRG